ncbi:MAG: carbon-nitrogen hydrolase family protein [Notoacmeibacter sp.]|nr:carbon-nitrogen hydrolase family protein [Notoacmeibacter sp.]
MTALSGEVRVAAVQLEMRAATPQAHLDRMHANVRLASGYGADFILFPEWHTLQMLASRPCLEPAAAMDWLSDQTDTLTQALAAMAKAENITIIGGAHPMRDGNRLQNCSPIALPDGTLILKPKLHPTPDERGVWGIQGGNHMDAFETPKARAGVAICYDSEFPEPVRRIADQGAGILFVPYYTETRHGHFRVRHCCQARAVENQTYVVTAGLFGEIGGVANAARGYAQSAIYTPCDLGFAHDGIAAQAEPNCDEVIFADLDLGRIARVREDGHVRNLADRRTDLYRIGWTGASGS